MKRKAGKILLAVLAVVCIGVLAGIFIHGFRTEDVAANFIEILENTEQRGSYVAGQLVGKP